MVSKDDVLCAYRYILGREPENPGALEAHMSLANVATLRAYFMDSAEFRNEVLPRYQSGENFFPSQTLEPMHVESEGSPEQLAAVLDRIRLEWEDFGKTEPHWSVLTHDTFKQKALDENRQEFFESGQFVTHIIDAFLRRHALTIPQNASCLELGCGVGRITAHLARRFKTVIGVDISKFHLEICAQELKDQAIDNVSLVCLDRPQTLLDLPAFDFFCSFIVLQHNPPPAMAFLLDTILGKLTRGGIAVFQLPTYRQGYRYDLKEYLSTPEPLHMEMHVLPQPQVLRIIERNSCRLLEIREDGWAEGRTTTGLSNTFFIVKQ